MIRHREAHILKFLIAKGGAAERDAVVSAYRELYPRGVLIVQIKKLDESGLITLGEDTVSVTAKGRREYELRCANRFNPEFFPSGWRALKPLREKFPHCKFQVTGTVGHEGDSGEVTCWVEVHRWHRTSLLGIILPPKRKRFFRFDAKYGQGRSGSGWAPMQGHESPQEMLAQFEFTEIVPC